MRFVVVLLAVFSSLAAIENSVVPAFDFLEKNAALNQKKYTKNQFAEIEAALKNSDEKLRIATFNMLRNDLDAKHKEENRWEQRLPRIVETLKEMNPDLIGSQELFRSQADQLLRNLTEYALYGEPRTDGELNGIFYRKSRLKMVDAKTIWIGKNNLAIAEFEDLKTGKRFAHLNIHASFYNSDDRENEARAIAVYAAKYTSVLVTGDLNTFPNRTDLSQLPFYDGDYFHRILDKSLRDSQKVSLLGHLGPIATFTNKPPGKTPFQGLGTPGVVLDCIYVSDPITVFAHATQPATVDGRFPSDHMPVFIDFLIP